MAFTNLLTTEVIVPTDGSLTPGSGTIYIGGPNLPAELVALGVTAALVGFSVPGVESSTLKYWFISDIPAIGWARGEVNQDGSVNIFEQIVVNGLAPYKPSLLYNVAFMAISSDGGIDFRNNNSVSEAARLTGLGSAPVIEATDSTTIDKWLTINSSTVTVDGSGGQHLVNCALNIDYRVTIDRVIEVRGHLQTSGLVNACDYLTLVYPAAVKALVIASPGNVPPHFAGASNNGGTVFVPITGRLDTTGNLILFTHNDPAGQFFYDFTATFTGAKP